MKNISKDSNNRNQDKKIFNYDTKTVEEITSKQTDYFVDQVQHFFRGQLFKLKNIEKEDVVRHIDFLITQIHALEKEEFFTKYEKLIRNSIKKDLKSSVLYSLVSKICGTNKEEMYDSSPRENAFKVIKTKLDLNNANNKSLLAHYLDNSLEEAFEDTYYGNNNVEKLILKAISIVSQDYSNLNEMSNIVNNSIQEASNFNNPEIQENILQLNLIKNDTVKIFYSLGSGEDENTYIKALEIFAFIFKYYERGLYPKLSEDELKKLMKFIEDNSLEEPIKFLNESKYFSLKYKIYSYLKKTLESQLIKSCSEYLVNEEKKEVENYNNRLNEEYNEEMANIDENPDSAEIDYDGIIYPSPPQFQEFYPENSQYIHEVFNEPDNITYLMQYSRNKGLVWLVHEKCEYLFEVDTEFLEEVINRDCPENIEPAILSTCMYSLLFHHTFPGVLDDKQFIAETYINSLKDLKQDKAIFKILSYSESLKEVYKTIAKNYVRTPEGLSNLLEPLRNSFNQAISKGNYLEAQKTWYVFCKYVFYTNAFLDYSPQGKNTNPKAITSVYKSLEKKLTSYREETKQHIIVFPTSSSTIIKYSSKKHNQDIQLNLAECFEELIRTENNIKKVINDVSGNYKVLEPDKIKSLNIVVPTLYFLVSDKPYDNNSEHNKIFIKVPINFTKYKNKLLSQDLEDEINKQEDNINERKYSDIRCSAKELHHYGKTLITNEEKDYREEILHENNSKLYHSEPLMLLSFQDSDNIREIISILESNLIKKLNLSHLQGKHKVYAALLVMYSTNSICDNCSFKLIGNQYRYKKGFTSKLEMALNADGEDFKSLSHSFITKNYNNGMDSFKLATIVASGMRYGEQAKLVEKVPLHYDDIVIELIKKNQKKDKDKLQPTSKTEETTDNEVDTEYGKLHFRKGIDIHMFLKGESNKCFIEYSEIKGINIQQNNLFNNMAFMSGSKKQKFVTQDNESFVTNIDNNINKLFLTGAVTQESLID